MLLSGTLLVDSTTVIREGAVVVEGSRIAAVGDRDSLIDTYPDHERRACDLLLPGLVGGHVHSVQSLGRGMADDLALLDWLYDHVLPMEAALDAEAVSVAAKLGYLELLQGGTTTAIDHLTVAHADAAFEAAGEMGIRGVLGKVLMDQHAPGERHAPAELIEDTEAGLAESERLLRRYHGAWDDRVRYAVTPRFALSCSEACLRGARRVADAHDGVRIHTHASESEAEVAAIEERTGKQNVHWLHEVGLTGDDVVLAHCVHTDESERALLEETGTHVVHCPSANMKLASGVAPVVEYRDRGIGVALGNDGPPCNNTLDEFTELRQASLLQKVDRGDATALPAEAVFEMATVGGARAAGFDRLGELREDWRADIVGLRTDRARATPIHDPHSHVVFAAHGDDVTFTMVDGDVLVDRGETVGVDRAAIRERASEIASGLDVA